jgi:hypothetical protein
VNDERGHVADLLHDQDASPNSCREHAMHKAERDHIMTRMSQAERDQFRRIIQDMRPRAPAALDHRVTARQVLDVQQGTLSPTCAWLWRP